MKTEIILKNQKNILFIQDKEVLISGLQDALDIISSARYEFGCEGILIFREAFQADFFDLKTKIAGEILQKFTDYGMRIALIGDFSEYTSKSLQDFIRESNKGKHFFFLSDEKEALEYL